MRVKTSATLAVLALVAHSAAAQEPTTGPVAPLWIPAPDPPVITTAPPTETTVTPTPTTAIPTSKPTSTPTSTPAPTEVTSQPTQRSNTSSQTKEASDGAPIPIFDTKKASSSSTPNLLRSSTTEVRESTDEEDFSPQESAEAADSSASKASASTASTSGSGSRSKSKTDGDSDTASTQGKKKKKDKDTSDNSDNDDFNDAMLGSACACNAVRKVSLMSASDYCLPPTAIISNKCGNAAVGENGECPRAEAQPCQDTGHVLRYPASCMYNKRVRVYQCMASKEDIYEQKYGKRKKKSNSNSTDKAKNDTSSAAPRAHRHTTLPRLLALAAAALLGLAVVA